MSLLARLGGPDDLKRLDADQIPQLAKEIRDFLVDHVSRTGGHLGPNLGAVELTLALHRVFDSPRDPILFDTGHQAYVHKMLTGRREMFSTLRQKDGLSGYPSQSESEHDFIENSHASTALSYADGMAKALALRGEGDRTVVAVVGDGALTGGMVWEALNNIAAGKDRRLVIVVNDNGRSYSPTVGGLANHLATLRVTQGYEHALSLIKDALGRTPFVGPPIYDTLHGVKKGIKDIIAPQALFEDLGIKYLGPVDGHDEQAVEWALEKARYFGGPVIVHCLTRKGFGYAPAENDDEDCLHSWRSLDPPAKKPETKKAWTKVFSDELIEIASERPDIVAITAAMLHPTGLADVKDRFPDRVFDVGIAEQHAVTSAAGLALGGLHPVVAVYATFLNRAFDQVLLDVGLHKLPVTFVLDRAGVTGPDGASHHGMWDMSLLRIVPGMRLAAPRDGARLSELLREAVSYQDGPTAVRFSRGSVGDDIPATETVDGIDVLRRAGRDVLVVSIGPLAEMCLEVADRLSDQGIGVTVVDPRWVSPVSPALAELARDHTLVTTVEDNGRAGGIGAGVAELLRDRDVDTPVKTFALPQEYLPHGKREQVLTDAGLTAQDLAREIVEMVAKRAPALEGQPAE